MEVSVTKPTEIYPIAQYAVSPPLTLTGRSFSWDSALTGPLTWSDGSTASTAWTFANTSTNTTMIASSALMIFSHTVQAEQLTSTDDITMLGHLFTVGSNDPIDIVFKFLGPFGGFSTLTGNQAQLEYSNLFKAPDIHVGSSLIAFGTSQLVGAVTIGEGEYNLPAVKGTIGHLVIQTSTGTPDQWGYVNPASLSVALAAAVTVTNSTDATSFIAMFDSATGDLPIRTETGLTYNSVTESLGVGGNLTVVEQVIVGEISVFAPAKVQIEAGGGALDTGLEVGLIIYRDDMERVEISMYDSTTTDASFYPTLSKIGNNAILQRTGGAVLIGTNTFAGKLTIVGDDGVSVSNDAPDVLNVISGIGAAVIGGGGGNSGSMFFTGREGVDALPVGIPAPGGDGGNFTVVLGIGGAGHDGGAAGTSGCFSVTTPGNIELIATLTKIGDGVNELQVSATGDLSFAGTAGFIYGHMNVPAANFITVDTSGTNDPVEVKSDGTGGESVNDGWESDYTNGTTFAASDLHYITVTIAGTYEVLWDISVRTAAGAGTVMHGGIMIDGVAQRDNGEGHTHIFNALDDIQLNGIGTVDCPNGNEEISLWVSNGQNQKTIIEHGNMRIKMIGGT